MDVVRGHDSSAIAVALMIPGTIATLSHFVSDVVRLSALGQMMRVDAERIIAGVHDNVFRRNRSVMDFIREPMCTFVPNWIFRSLELPIAVRAFGPLP